MDIRTFFVFGVAALIGAAIALLLALVKIRFVKYIPSILIGILTIGMFIYGKWFATGDMADLAAIVSSMLFGAAALGALIAAIIVDIVKKKKA